MSRSPLFWLIIGAIALSAALAWLTLTRGAASVAHRSASEHHALAPFHELEVGGTATVLLVQGGAEAIDVEAGSRGNAVDAHVADGRLVVWSRDRRRWWARLFGRPATEPPSITIHFKTLDRLALSGNVNVSVPRLSAPVVRIGASGGTTLAIDDLQAGSLRVDGSGALKADLAGRVDTEHVSISGAGSYRADRLRAKDATVSVSGVGNVVLHAEHKLRASISGAGLIEYVGDPEVTEHVSGIGRVRRRDAAESPRLHVARLQAGSRSRP
jgi:putative autotransporter adhesin-like protein